MGFIKILAGGMIGLLLGVGIFQLDTNGFFERWKKLTSPSTDILNLFEIEGASSGNGVEITKPCNFSTPEFSFVSNYPKDIVDCVQKIVREADVYTKSAYAKDSKGIIWEWRLFSYAYAENSKLFMYPLLGFAFGLAITFHFHRQTMITI